MANVSGGLLAAETCRAGALGFIGAGHNLSVEEVDKEISIFRRHVPNGPLCIGFIGHSTFADNIAWNRYEQVLEKHEPHVVQFFAPSVSSRDDGKTNIDVAHEYNCLVLAQVGSESEGLQALEAGADGIITVGREGGGHGLRREVGNGTLALAARLVSLTKATSVPVLAAGGIVDGRGVAAALALGCGGAVLGTRLWASTEAMGPVSFKEQLASSENGPDQVIRTTCVDQIMNSYSSTPWPEPYDSVGMLINQTTRKWDNRTKDLSTALTSDGRVASEYKEATAGGNPSISAVYCGEGVGDINAIESAQDIVRRVNTEAVEVIKGLPQLLIQ